MIAKKVELNSLIVRSGNEHCELLWRDSGRVIILSSYGDWSYWWSHPGGDSMVEFMTEINCEYTGQKMIGADFYKPCPQATAKLAREHIVQYRGDCSIEKEVAREEWGLARQLDDGDIDISTWVAHSEIQDAWEMIGEVPSNAWMHFWRTLWKPCILPELRLIVESTTVAA